MLNTYVSSEAKYTIKFTYQSLMVENIDNVGLKSKRVVVKQNPTISFGTIIYSPKIGIKFLLYDKAIITE